MKFLFLSIAIVAEVIATSALKSSDGFTRVGPTFIVFSGYAIAFYFLSLTLKVMPVGHAYAIWSGAGIALIAMAGWLLYNQKPDVPALLGMGLIFSGVVILSIFSNTSVH